MKHRTRMEDFRENERGCPARCGGSLNPFWEARLIVHGRV